MINLMNEYIKVVKVNMNQFIKTCLDNRYVKKVADDFIDAYAEIRYFGLIESKKGFTVKNKILTETRKLKDELVDEEEDKRKIRNIELTYVFFDSCIALNEKTSTSEIADEIKLISKLRKEHLGIQETEEFKNSLMEIVKNANAEKEKILNLTVSEEFYLRFVNYKTSNLRRTILKYNIKFPAIYSNDAISKAFNSGTTNEDKLFIEYYLLTAQIIADIEEANYRRQYVAEFADTILEKPQKLARLLEIINNPSVQDRLIMKIDYNTVNNLRDNVYELLRNGYKIAVNLDGTFGASEADVQRLTMFPIVFVKKSAPYYETIKSKLNNLIEI